METVEEKKIGKYLIKIYPDDGNESPNDWWDDEKFLIFDHRDLYVERDGFNPDDIFENGETVKGYHVFRCYAYIHGGVALDVDSHTFPDARWDVSFKGFWLIKRVKGTWTRKHALTAALDLCKTWNQYLSGDVYCYKIYNENDEEIDSCWGYYGVESCMEAAEDIVNYLIDDLDTYLKGQ